MRLFRRSDDSDRRGGARWIVVGLGNPGAKYEDTRHNAGAMVAERLLPGGRGDLKRHKSGCLVGEITVGGERVIVARPTSYMNESGRPVGELARWYKIAPENLVVVHDELDIPFGDVRVKAGGGTAGHNGLRSLAAHLGTNEFIRVRVGISRPGGADAVDHVLAGFRPGERKQLPDVLDRAAEAVERIITEGPERAMNAINTRP